MLLYIWYFLSTWFCIGVNVKKMNKLVYIKGPQADVNVIYCFSKKFACTKLKKCIRKTVPFPEIKAIFHRTRVRNISVEGFKF